MEMIGLALAFPVVLVANLGYVLLARWALRRRPGLRPWLLWPSLLALLAVVTDVLLVASMGAVGARRLLGQGYWPFHLASVALGAPALANVALSTGGQRWHKRWWTLAGACFIVGMLLVFFQVGVGDSLFGPDGVGGPYGRPGSAAQPME